MFLRPQYFATAAVHRKGRLPVWVLRVTLTVRRSLPVFPDKQTFSESVGTSQRCQYRNSLAIGMTHVDRQWSLRAHALEHTETRDVHERHYAYQLEAGVLEERPLRWTPKKFALRGLRWLIGIPSAKMQRPARMRGRPPPSAPRAAAALLGARRGQRLGSEACVSVFDARRDAELRQVRPLRIPLEHGLRVRRLGDRKSLAVHAMPMARHFDALGWSATGLKKPLDRGIHGAGWNFPARDILQ